MFGKHFVSDDFVLPECISLFPLQVVFGSFVDKIKYFIVSEVEG